MLKFILNISSRWFIKMRHFSKTQFLLIVLLLYYAGTVQNTNVENVVEFSSMFREDEETHNSWFAYDNIIFKTIHDAQMEYNNTASDVQSALKQIIDDDLLPFKRNRISSKLVKSASPYGTVYQLIKHTLYRSKECMFPFRCEGIEHFLKKFTNLSDYEIVVNTRDYPQVPKSYSRELPVFSFSKTQEYADIMYPAWSFWCGGPAIKLHPTGIGRWDKMRKSLLSEMKKWPWQNKKKQAFFRGSRTSSERDELIYLSREAPDLVDAAYTKNQAWKSAKDTLNAEPAQEVSFEEHCQYKYLFNFRGVAASFRFKHLFLCKSLVFHVGNEWTEYFYSLMKPWVHYVPIESNYNRNDIRKILEFFIRHENVAKKIAENGYELVKKHLKLSDVSWYWKTLLEEYIKLQSFTPVLDRTLKRIS